MTKGHRGEPDSSDTAAFLVECLQVWERIAPSFVRRDVAPPARHVLLAYRRDYDMTPDDFAAALEIAMWNRPDVPRRRALFYAYGIIRKGGR